MGHVPVRMGTRVASAAAVVSVLVVALVASPAIAAAPSMTAGSIQVVDGDGTPLAGAVITLTHASVGSPEYTAATLADGSLDLTTVPGFDPAENPYLVWVDANGYAGYWDRQSNPDETTPLQIVAGQQTVVADVVTTNSPPDATSAGISGTVTDALTGEPLLGIQVAAVDDGNGGNGNGLGGGQSGPDGTYYLNFSGGTLPSTAAVSFTSLTVSDDAPYGYAAQYYDGINVATIQPETPVPVQADTETSNIDARLTPNGLLSGVVTEADGGSVHPLRDVAISVWNVEAKAEVVGGSSAADGTYSLPVTPGTYVVQFDRIVDGKVVSTQYYDHADSFDAGTRVDIAANRKTSGIDAQFGAVPRQTPTPTPTATATATATAELPATGPPELSAVVTVSLLALIGGAVLLLRRRRLPQHD